MGIGQVVIDPSQLFFSLCYGQVVGSDICMPQSNDFKLEFLEEE